MKNLLKTILQKALGFETYLYLFSRYIIITLKYNRREGDFIYFRDMIKGEGCILDIGANIGAMSVHLAKRHPASGVFAFEPLPFNYKTIERVMKHYSLNNICIVKSALGSSCGKAEMMLPIYGRARQQGLSHVVHQSIEGYDKGEKFECEMLSIDAFVEHNLKNMVIKAIKLDVENFEYYVLEGGRESISSHKPLIYCELWDNDNRKKCLELMKELNYTVKVLENKKLITFDAGRHLTQNFFFIPAFK